MTNNYGTSLNWVQAYNWGNHANVGYATQNYVSQNYYQKTGGQIDGNVVINSINSHLFLAENDVKRWHIESVGGEFSIIETGVSGRLRIRPGATTMQFNDHDIWHSGNFNPGEKVSAVNSSYSIDWDGFENYLVRNGNLVGYLWNSSNFNPNTKANAENNAVTIGFDNGKIEMPYIKHNSGTSYLFSTKPVTYHGASYNANDIHRSGFYSIGHGMKETGNYSGSQDGARALIHFETEDVYSASQIQTERYTGNMVSRTKTDGGWSNWVRHWGSNDFTAGDIANWNNAISQSSASEEIILEDGQLAIQPDEFSLKGSSSYDIASRRKLIHVLFREGNELNIGKIRRRQTFVIFNFEKSSVSINIEGLKPYLLAAANKITLYIDDEGEVLMYDESNFKKLG